MIFLQAIMDRLIPQPDNLSTYPDNLGCYPDNLRCYPDNLYVATGQVAEHKQAPVVVALPMKQLVLAWMSLLRLTAVLYQVLRMAWQLVAAVPKLISARSVTGKSRLKVRLHEYYALNALEGDQA